MDRLVFIISILTLFSCKKEDLELFIQGNVNDPNLNISVAGAQVVLSGQEISGGTFNPSFITQATTTTNGNGHFEIKFPRKTISTYRIEVTKDNYFRTTIEITGDAVQPDETYNVNIDVLPMAYYQLTLKNNPPTDEFDRISYRNVNADLSCDCCNNQTLTLIGEQIDTTFTCAHEGESWLHYWYEIEQNGNAQAFGDSIFLTPFDTTFKQINF